MLEKIVAYFTERHLLTNLIVLGVIIGGVLSWQNIKKEEMPDVTFDFVRISASYPGATAKEVEHFVTRELEDAVKGIDGVYRVTSTAAQGSTRISVELEKGFRNKDEAIMEIRNAVSDTRLPDDVRDEPSVRVFKTSKKAIIDIALYHTDVHLLDNKTRRVLQEYAFSLESQLMNLPQVNSISKSGYLQEEIQINVDPQKLKKYTIPLSQVKRVITENHSRQPAGNIEAKNEPKVTIDAQLNTVEKLKNLYIQAGFEGQAVTLKQVAEVENTYARKKAIIKVNGHQAVIFRAVKNTSYGILDSINAVTKEVNRFRENYTKESPIDIVLLDDESMDVRNRLHIISVNGGIGFLLILLMLFLFLNKKSGFWVGMGIPFTICFTLVCSKLLGFTINNITLAGVIIVMGIVVDDAIVIAENISRSRIQGMNSYDAAVKGTMQVFLPVLASLVTTCIAFIPLYFFSGRFGRLINFIPPIIFMMLGASLIESLFILPGHMHLDIPVVKKLFKKAKKTSNSIKAHWFDKIENAYGGLLKKILPYKPLVFLSFFLLLALSGWILTQKMKFVMFPREETREISVSGYAGKQADRYETAEITKEIEAVIEPYIGQEAVGSRTQIARSRRGGAVEENRFSMVIEIVPKEKREKSADELVAEWQSQIKGIKGLEKFVIQKSRWGHSSGSAIEILVKENDDLLRERASNKLAELMKENPALKNVDIERPILIPEYKIDFLREKTKRLSISPTDISSTFRISLEGTVLYELPNGDEEIDVRLSVWDRDKTDINRILEIPVENNRDYLVPLRDVITMQKTKTPNSISRRDSKRITTVYADIAPKSKLTPLEIAEELEQETFQKVIISQPSTTLEFTGEVADTRESQGDLKAAVIMVILLIFAILAVLFNSLTRPFIIILAIPFGMVGVILAFFIHGKILFGFFAAIGCLGLAGVVINDSIVMISKLDIAFHLTNVKNINEQIATIAQTRLKAVVLTTVTTVSGILPTAYGLAGYDSMLAEMMLALAWGLVFGTLITLLLVPCLYSVIQHWKVKLNSLIG
ncbi:efflux RND transporter permease subunit [bacterium]